MRLRRRMRIWKVEGTRHGSLELILSIYQSMIDDLVGRATGLTIPISYLGWARKGTHIHTHKVFQPQVDTHEGWLIGMDWQKHK
jgi:hypothetical protein